jgi:hypothetical protein
VADPRVASPLDPSFQSGPLATARFVVIGGPIEFQDAARPPDRDAPNYRKPSSPARACEQVLQFSANDVVKHLAIQWQFGHDLLQLRILALEPAGTSQAAAGPRTFSSIEIDRLTHSGLPTDVGDANPRQRPAGE